MEKIDIYNYLEKFHCTRYGQMKTIVSEFVESLPNDDLENAWNTDRSNIFSILEQLKPAFRAHKNVSPTNDVNIWELDKEAYLECFSNESSNNSSKEKNDFDTVWRHFSIISIIRSGEDDQYAPIAQGFEPKTEEIETIAFHVLQCKYSNSPTLERLILDGLIYTETFAFAQNVYSDRELFGTKLQSKIKGTSNSSSKSLKKNIKNLLKEGAGIAITFVIASFLTGTNETAAWIITSIYTAARWILSAMNLEKTSEFIQHNLLSKMILIHHYFSKSLVNAELLRNRLYEVESLGAMFSPYVYEILDKQINSKKR